MAEEVKFVGSLPVPNVQQLAATYDDTVEKDVPSRYVRPEVMSEDTAPQCGEQMPVIDFSKLVDPRFSEEEENKLDAACQEWGFFQLINHGIPSDVIDGMRNSAQEFFKLPLPEKLKFSQLPGNLEGYGQLFVVSNDQKLDWADMLYFDTKPDSSRHIEYWPTNPSTFRGALDDYSVEVGKVAHLLMSLMAKKLGVDPEKGKFAELFENGNQAVRINYYPPCPQADKVIGFSPHSDAAAFTLVLQVNDVQGLQIKRNGCWFPVYPLPGAFIGNIGDIYEILSNGTYKSILHRAVVNTEQERLAIAAFHMPNSGATIGPLPEVVKDGEEYYRTIDQERMRKLFFSSKLDGKSFLGRMKLKP